MELKDISKKRQKKRKDTDLYKVKEDISKPKFYILDMFPYPSGSALHVGHPKGYIATDALARKKMLQGFNVLHPMGFDTFGLGTEQYAIEHKMKPQDVSKQNIAKFISQLENFWTTYDRSRAVNTADPKYFKWTQRVFLQMYNHYYDTKLAKALPIKDLELRIKNWKDLSYLSSFTKGGEPLAGEDLEKFLNSQRLAYVDYKPINRCPKCMTWLANEDLDDGKCERCWSVVEQKPMKQRVLRITKYADRLLEWLDTLKREESMKDLERNWIGKSEGTEFDMQVDGMNEKFSVYTTRIDTVFGMSFVAIAPEHPLVDKITTKECHQEVEKYKDAAKHKSQLERTELQKEKTGVFCGAYAINPFNGEKVKIFVADYVLANYGTGVVMAVPAHDERDFEFAKKYNLPIAEVIIKWPHPEPFSSKEKGWSSLPKNEKWFSLYQWIDKDIEQFTKELRKEQTSAEKVFWELVRNNKLWLKFRRQHPFGRYIVDFYCHELKLVIEIDWSIHDIEENKKRDKQRQEDLKMEWLHIMRFTNDELFDNPQKILEKIIKYKNKISPRLEGEGEEVKSSASPDSAFTKKWILVNSWEFSGLESDEAIKKMQAWLEKKWIGGVKVNYKMQDRVFSRQRYRGEPFPVLRDESWNIVALDENDLPLLLPDVDNYEPTGTEEGPLAAITDRVNVTKDGKKYKRETNTMPGRAGSSRYRLRYMDVNNEKELVGKDKEKYRGNVDVYVWGAEHITRHMIYGRFWQKFLFDIDVISHDEPFQEYHSVGLIMWEDGRKMSKRRGNVVNPDDIINQFWADTLRTYEMFMGPFDQSIAWNTAWISGTKKFLDKVQNLFEKIQKDTTDSDETKILLHQTIKKLTDNIDEFKFNTAISQLMILTNHLTDCWSISRTTFETLVILLSPFAPHLAEELWEQLGNEYSLFTKATWPTYDEKCLVADTVTIGVQVNGKMRGTICISKDAEQNEALQAANSDEKIKSRITSEPKKVIYVKGKILNIVV